MNGRRWTILFGLLLIAVPVAVWLLRPPGRMSEERAVAERLRAAKALYVKAFLGNESFGPERLALDGEALARAFRLREKHGRKSVSSNRRVELLTSPDGGEVLALAPPTAAFLDVTLYTIDPGFWTELLRQAPKTRTWLEQKSPNLLVDGVPSDQ